MTLQSHKELNLEVELYRVDDGLEALSFLRRTGPFTNAPRPDLILVNLSLPKMSGVDVLAAIRSDDSLKNIPTVMFSSSALDYGSGQMPRVGRPRIHHETAQLRRAAGIVEAACAHAGAQ